MSTGYEPKAYWDARLTAHGGLRGTGHISFGEGYNQWLYRAKDRALLGVLEDRPLEGLRVLDVGCGTGYFIRWYGSRGAKVTGIDISPRAIERLGQEQQGEYHVMDVTEPSAASLGQFDIVNVWDVMYHIVDDARFERALRFIASQVAPGGLLLISDLLAAPADVRVAEHVRMRQMNTYQSVLGASGFELARRQFLYRWLNRYVSLPFIDSALGGFYYWLDGRETRIPSGNLSLGAWRRITSS